MQNVRIIAIVLVAALVMLMILWSNGFVQSGLCRHFHDGWLEKSGVITCRRAF